MFHSTWHPPADIHHAGAQWLIKLELAGVSSSDVQIRARNAELTVRGQRRDLLQSGFVCHRLEIRYTTFERTFTLPAPIDAGSIACEYRDGILRIWLNTL
jgi:HSP20 family molecular chaperone IbpA